MFNSNQFKMKTIRIILTTAMISTIGLTACDSGGNSGENHEHQETEAAVYHCPMECEGDKTYSEEGTCPKCGMELVLKEE